MTKFIVATLLALGVGAAAPSTQTRIESSAPEALECIAPEADPEPMSCKAAGQDCDDAEDCCSRMCPKAKKKCA